MPYLPHDPELYEIFDDTPASPPPSDTTYLDSSVCLSQREQVTKRRRIGDLARDYLQGKPLYISTAALKGPFDGSWETPWRTTTGNAVYTVEDPEELRDIVRERLREAGQQKKLRAEQRRERRLRKEERHRRAAELNNGTLNLRQNRSAELAVESVEEETERASAQNARGERRVGVHEGRQDEWLKRQKETRKTPDTVSDIACHLGTPSRSYKPQESITNASQPSQLTTPPETDSASEGEKQLRTKTKRRLCHNEHEELSRSGASLVISEPNNKFVTSTRAISSDEADVTRLLSSHRISSAQPPEIHPEAKRVPQRRVTRGRSTKFIVPISNEANDARCTSSNRLHRSQLDLEGLRQAKRLSQLALASLVKEQHQAPLVHVPSSPANRFSQPKHAVKTLEAEDLSASLAVEDSFAMDFDMETSRRISEPARLLEQTPVARDIAEESQSASPLLKKKAIVTGKLRKLRKTELLSPGFTYKKTSKNNRRKCLGDLSKESRVESRGETLLEATAPEPPVSATTDLAINVSRISGTAPSPALIPAVPNPNQDIYETPLESDQIDKLADQRAQREAHNATISTAPSVPHISGVFAQNVNAYTISGNKGSHAHEDLSTQAAFSLAQEAFRADLRSPLKDDPMFPLFSDSESQPNVPAVVDTITPFRDFNLRIRRSTGSSRRAPRTIDLGPSTQDLLDAASPFAMSTIKKSRSLKRLSFAAGEAGPIASRSSKSSLVAEIKGSGSQVMVPGTPAKHQISKGSNGHGALQSSSPNIPRHSQPIPKHITFTDHEDAQRSFSLSPEIEFHRRRKAKSPSPLSIDLTSFSISSSGAVEEHLSQPPRSSLPHRQSLKSEFNRLLRDRQEEKSPFQSQEAQELPYMQGEAEFDISAAIEEAGSFLKSWNVESELRSFSSGVGSYSHSTKKIEGILQGS